MFDRAARTNVRVDLFATEPNHSLTRSWRRCAAAREDSGYAVAWYAPRSGAGADVIVTLLDSNGNVTFHDLDVDGGPNDQICPAIRWSQPTGTCVVVSRNFSRGTRYEFTGRHDGFAAPMPRESYSLRDTPRPRASCVVSGGQMNGFVRRLFVAGTASLVIYSASVASTDPEVEALKKQVERLQLRVNTLDAQVKELLARADASPATPAALAAPVAATSPTYEAEAQAIINDVIRLTDEGQADAARAKLDELRAKYGASKVAGQGTYFSNEIAVIGKNAPADWGLNTWFQGRNEIDLSGKPTTLVVFFEEWCPHCRDEMPKLQQLYAARHSQGLQVLGITTVTQTSTDEKVRSYLRETHIQFPVAKESGSASTHFNVKGIPAAAIVKGGKVVWRGHPIRLTDEVVSRWLAAR